MSGVAYPHSQVGARLDLWRGGRSFRIHIKFGKGYLQYAPILTHGMCCIGAKVHQHLMDLRGVSLNSSQILFYILPDLNSGRQGGPQHFQTLFDDGLDIQRLPLLLALATEGQDLLHQIFGPMGCLDGLLQIVLGFGILRCI